MTNLVWYTTPYFSVYLVFVLSMVRTYNLLRPFNRTPHRIITIVTALYLTILILKTVLPNITGVITVQYTRPFALCLFVKNDDKPDKEGVRSLIMSIIIHTNTIQLMIPVIPVILSCAVSVFSVRRSAQQSCVNTSRVYKKLSKDCPIYRKKRGEPQYQASVTIVLLTLVYLVCNLPVFLFYTLHLIQGHNGTFFASDVVYNWGWNIVFAFLVVVNATVNPVVYWTRIRKFRVVIRDDVRRILVAVLCLESDRRASSSVSVEAATAVIR